MNAPAKNDPVVITSAMRTPLGSLQGALRELTAPALGAAAIAAALRQAALPPEHTDEVLMGCVLTAGQGQAPARQAALMAGLSPRTPCTQVGKVCGSGLKAVTLAHDALVAGSARIVVAGGMESMSSAPHLLPRSRAGYRLGDAALLDHLLYDGLQDAYEHGASMGLFAERCAAAFGFTRTQQDAYALASLERARAAMADGRTAREITPLTLRDDRGDREVTGDEQLQRARPEKIPTLRPAFMDGGTITAATSSSISDGAAALTLMRLSQAEARGIAPLARIAAHAGHAQEPARFTTAPAGAIRALMDRTGWSLSDVDAFEINEAFAVVVLAAMRELNLPQDRVNLHGGACALGHPIGASGARILVTLLNVLAAHDLRRGVATLCIGGGEALAIAVERIHT